MKVSDLFNVSYGNSLELVRLKQTKNLESINFVSRTSKNNMVSARVRRLSGVTPSPAGTLSVALGGTVLETALQSEPYYSGYHVAILTAREPMTDVEKLFWASCIMENRYRFSYGRQANKSLASLELPEEVPLWVSGMVIPDHSAASEPLIGGGAPKVDSGNWGKFVMGDLFEIVKKKAISGSANNMNVPVVSASRFNNGVSRAEDRAPEYPAGLITISVNGSIGECFYQPNPFIIHTDVVALSPKGFDLNPLRASFIATIFGLEKYRYNYGRKLGRGLLERTIISLPVTSDGDVDWLWIDAYMGTLPYSSSV